ncbi:MAG: flavin-dependent oxidoreductase [Xanthobacteraceae bacterium]|nr:flavin-dependent oxidoreductase [Xanthobacteraceae bacterium]
MTVLIAGGGIGGLALALSLHQIGVKCRVFESVKEIKPLGVGINVLPHAGRELIELGLLEELDRTGVRTSELAYFSKHGKQIWSEPRGLEAGYKWPQFSIHRGELQLILLRAVIERIGKENALTGHHVSRWEETANGVRVFFTGKDGEALPSEDGSLLIAADGIHSAVRAHYHPEEGAPLWNRRILWRGVTKGKPYLSGRSMIMAGYPQVKFVAYPISREDSERGEPLINWIAERELAADYEWRREDYNRAGKPEEFAPWFKDWDFGWLDVPGLIRDAEYVFEYPVVDRDPLSRWTHGRVTLLGDAAHPMYPIGSNGSSQAILDARVLAREIQDKGETNAALEAYEAERRPATSQLVLLNRGNGPERVMEMVEQRAPNGFNVVTDVLSKEELEEVANNYKRVAGFQVEGLNAKPSIVQPRMAIAAK